MLQGWDIYIYNNEQFIKHVQQPCVRMQGHRIISQLTMNAWRCKTESSESRTQFNQVVSFIPSFLLSFPTFFVRLSLFDSFHLHHSVLHSLIRSFAHSLIHSFTHSFLPSFIHSLICPSIHSVSQSCIPSLLPSCLHSFIHAFIHSFSQSFICSFSCLILSFVKRLIRKYHDSQRLPI